jgi:TolA-binding protein
MKFFRVLAIASAAALCAQAQSKQDFQQIQRDLAQLEFDVKEMKKAQDEKIAALTVLVQQSLDASTKISSGLSQLQTSLTTTLSEQQRGVVAPIAALGKEVEQMSGDFRSVQTNVSELGSQISRVDSKLADISSAVRILSTAQAQAPPPPALAAEPQPPAGVTAVTQFENARRDYSAKRDELALAGFSDYIKYFPKTEDAPRAQYFIGMIYDRAEQYEDAIQAFDAVMERYPEHPTVTPDSLYMKAADLMKLKRRTDAVAEFQEFIGRYPSHDSAPKARSHLRELGMTPAPAKTAPVKRR